MGTVSVVSPGASVSSWEVWPRLSSWGAAHSISTAVNPSPEPVSADSRGGGVEQRRAQGRKHYLTGLL